MNFIKNICLTSAIILSLSSCHDFLDIKPVNAMIPESVEDYQAVLLGGYPVNDIFINTEYMTDNVYANPEVESELSNQAAPWFTWAPSHQPDEQEIDPYWNQLYRSIYYSNTVLDELLSRDVSPADKELYETVVGEAYALRAFSYFYLANLYADVYSPDNLSKPCVPMPLTAVDVHQNTKNNVRESIETVWNQIVEDLKKAKTNLNGKAKISEFRFDYLTVNLLTARVNLFMNNLEEAIDNSSIVISKRKPWDMNGLQAIIDKEETYKIFDNSIGLIDTDYKQEVLFTLGGGTGGAGGNPFYWWKTLVKPAPELLGLYLDENQYDYRRLIFESHADLTDDDQKLIGPTMYHMYSFQPESGVDSYYIGFKVSEAYLIRAEANARKGGNESMVINDLNELLINRISNETFEPLKVSDISSGDELLKKVLLERRKETAFDGGLRWFDLRRLGKPALTHEYISDRELLTASLKLNDPRYILQIPVSEQKNSPNMVLNPR